VPAPPADEGADDEQRNPEISASAATKGISLALRNEAGFMGYGVVVEQWCDVASHVAP
jgi:hypothetical protein